MRRVRLGIVGAGWWATENHIPVLQSLPGVEISGICSVGSSEILKVQKTFSIPFGTERYEDLLAREGLDGIVISSPHDLHFEHASMALKSGLHVICEKPMVLHASEAWALVDLAQSQNRHFLIPYGWNYKEYARAARACVSEGLIGRIEYVQCFMGSALRDLFSGTGAWFADESFAKPLSTTWANPKTGGGFAHGQLSHAIGLLLFITGLEPLEVFGLIGASETGADLFNSMCCKFKNNVIGVLGGAATMPPNSIYQLDIRIFGNRGMLLLDIERPRLEIHGTDGRKTVFPFNEEPGKYDCVEPLRTFVALIRGELVENRSSARLGAQVVGMLEGLFYSAQQGRSVDLQQLSKAAGDICR